MERAATGEVDVLVPVQCLIPSVPPPPSTFSLLYPHFFDLAHLFHGIMFIYILDTYNAKKNYQSIYPYNAPVHSHSIPTSFLIWTHKRRYKSPRMVAQALLSVAVMKGSDDSID